jgi:hypothetical protein
MTLKPAEPKMLLLQAGAAFSGDESIEDYILNAAIDRARADQELFTLARRPAASGGVPDGQWPGPMLSMSVQGERHPDNSKSFNGPPTKRGRVVADVG